MADQTLAERRDGLVAALRERGRIRSERVAAAFSRVPREVFLPFVRPDKLYQDLLVITQVDRLGRPSSSSSMPAIMASVAVTTPASTERRASA